MQPIETSITTIPEATDQQSLDMHDNKQRILPRNGFT
jgi:hypothetical protein